MKNILEPGKAYTLKGKYFDDKYGVGAKAYIEDTTEKVLGEDWVEKILPITSSFIQRYLQYNFEYNPISIEYVSFDTKRYIFKNKQTYYAKVTRLGEVTGGLGEIITSDDIIPEQEIAKMRDDIIKNEIYNSSIGQRFMEEEINNMYDEADDPFTGF